MVALSNTQGGAILVGVTDERVVAGRRLDQATEDNIHQAASAAHDVGRYLVRELTVDGRPVVAVEVSRREEGFAQTSDGRLLVRKGGRNVALIGGEAWDFMSARAWRRFEQMDSAVRIEDADHEALDELCSVYSWNPSGAELRDRLRERRLATADGRLTIAGALFLTDPSASVGLAKASVEVRRYPDDSPDYDRRVVFSGPLQRQVRDAAGFLMDELGRDLVVAGLYRYELPRLPEVVVREALANAVAHRSYEIDRTAIVVEMRPDNLIITSPGRLPEPVTVTTMRQAQAARNPSVIDVLRRFSLAEDAGRGVDVMEDTMEEFLLDPPQFAEGPSSVVVTLPLRGPITPRERAWVADLERRGELAATDRFLLVYAARGEQLTNARAREILGVDSTAARHALHRLRDSGLLLQHGERGGATYTLADDVAPPAVYRLDAQDLERLVLEAAAEESLSNESVRRATGLDRAAALGLLQRLVDEGKLVRVGERRGTRYHLP